MHINYNPFAFVMDLKELTAMIKVNNHKHNFLPKKKKVINHWSLPKQNFSYVSLVWRASSNPSQEYKSTLGYSEQAPQKLWFGKFPKESEASTHVMQNHNLMVIKMLKLTNHASFAVPPLGWCWRHDPDYINQIHCLKSI